MLTTITNTLVLKLSVEIIVKTRFVLRTLFLYRLFQIALQSTVSTMGDFTYEEDLVMPSDSEEERDFLTDTVTNVIAGLQSQSDNDDSEQSDDAMQIDNDADSEVPDVSDDEDLAIVMDNVPGELYPDHDMMNYGHGYDIETPDDIANGWERILGGPDPGPPLGFPPFTGESGTNVNGTAPMDFFCALFRDTMWGEIAQQTNMYAERRQALLGGDAVARMDHPDYRPHARINTWSQVTAQDMKTFVAHLIIMGLVRKPDIESYWCQKGLSQTPFFGKFMSRRQFQAILSNFHVADDSLNPAYGQPGHNPLAKLQPFLDMINASFRNAYKPGQDVSIDEGCCPWKGRLRFKQYNPRKPARFHIKLFQVADPATGYVVHFKIYTGKNSCHRGGNTLDDETSTTTTKTVMTLCKDAELLDKGHCIYFDNWFNSPQLLEELWSRETKGCGTARHRSGAPECMKKKKIAKALQMESGECYYRRKGPILVFKWQQKRTVYMITTNHTAVMTCTGKKDRTTDEPIYKPKAIIEYTQHMGGVDLSDQLMNYYHFLRRGCKWWRKLWVHMFNMVILNAYVLNKTFGAQKLNHNQYRHYLATALLGVGTLDDPVDMQLPGNSHYPERLPMSTKTGKIKTRICVYCKVTKPADIVIHGAKHTKASTIICSRCKVPLCTYPCFALYHTKK